MEAKYEDYSLVTPGVTTLVQSGIFCTKFW